jgi:F-type H+-transporting ATPase subunit alpha
VKHTLRRFFLLTLVLERACVIADDGIARNMNDLPDSLKGIVKGGGSLTLYQLSKLK